MRRAYPSDGKSSPRRSGESTRTTPPTPSPYASTNYSPSPNEKESPVIETIRFVVEIAGVLLGFVALYLAIKHLKGIHEQRVALDTQAAQLNRQSARLNKELNRQAKKLDEQTEKLEQTLESLPTRFIGVFPTFLPQITDLIRRATESITIVCDFPSYGHYSNLPEWLDYRNAIQRQSMNITVRLTCYDETRRKFCHDRQFSSQTLNWKDYKLEARARLRDFLLFHHQPADDESIVNLSSDKFAALLEEADKEMLDDVFISKAHVNPVGVNIPLYFWVIDEKEGKGEAIFTIPSFSNKQLEYGFYTRVSKLISAFAEMSDSYQSQDGSE
jgi:hypothetical protein